ncbi:hypothetical protein LQ772_13580 [Frateuria edaphi]|jgi:hypothetical protein|uniref:hypothetical protein n=1 Tax=Frateuria edaphi TaxID=2898793 RepID=UPI001E5C639B|nr:hypothetical protein [Frateuria edaphi]UGB45010.1 hypothetical protein LQ772_13580 [Frateuria edaphi]
MTKPRTTQGTPDEPKSTAERKPPDNPPEELEIPEDTLAAASTRDPTIINRTS